MIGTAAGVLGVVGGVGALAGHPAALVPLVLAVAFCCYFFRDPERVAPDDERLVVSPADGRVLAVVEEREERYLKGPATRVSIFMSPLDAHVNRAPVAGRVTTIAYRPGKFINAELDKASEDNERNGIVLDSVHGPVGVVQIAGLVARRIVCFVREGDALAPGERIGLIRFGSRLDVWLPPAARVLVAEGQTAIAGETVLARFGGGDDMRRVRID